MTDQTPDAEGWRPQDGESIEGRVAELTKGWSDAGSTFYPIVVLKTASGHTAVHCFHAVLKNRLMDIQPKIGDRLKITKMGKKPSKDGRREITMYRVEAPDHEQDTATFWQGIGASSPARDAGPTATAVEQDELPF